MKHKRTILLLSKTKMHTTTALHVEYAADVIGYGFQDRNSGDFVTSVISGDTKDDLAIFFRGI